MLDGYRANDQRRANLPASHDGSRRYAIAEHLMLSAPRGSVASINPPVVIKRPDDRPRDRLTGDRATDGPATAGAG